MANDLIHFSNFIKYSLIYSLYFILIIIFCFLSFKILYKTIFKMISGEKNIFVNIFKELYAEIFVVSKFKKSFNDYSGKKLQYYYFKVYFYSDNVFFEIYPKGMTSLAFFNDSKNLYNIKQMISGEYKSYYFTDFNKSSFNLFIKGYKNKK